ncbi:MAG: exodeoxyribonuclease VII large subunit [Isosphaeraceae bacterium]
MVVTSPTGAAVRDFLQVTGRRWPAAEILIAPTLVQGPSAAEQVAAALALADTVAGADLIVLARGGGSVEDLGAFNQEVVARAIAASRTPVVSAVGHEIDVTLADLVADHRAATPTEAGERCVPDAREVAQHLDRLGDRLARAGEWHLDDARARLEDLSDRATRALTRTLDDRRHSLSRLAARLEALSPLAVLSRGYSLTLHPDGRPVRGSAEVRPGDLLTTRLAAGQVVSRVVEAE